MFADRNGRLHRGAGSEGGRLTPQSDSAPASALEQYPAGRQAESRLRVPAVVFEEHTWLPQNPDLFSRSEVRRQSGPYESALTAEINDWAPVLDAELAADIDDATRALGDFDTHASIRLGSGDPALGPMAAILLRTESASSSQIEQLTTSARQLALAEIEEGDRANASVVIGNVRAMEAAVALADDLDEQAILAMHGALMQGQSVMRNDAGRFRDELVWIGGRDSAGPRGASYIAPQHRHVPEAIADLVRFMARDDLPPLTQIAVAHAQFETIHPFTDGNGRTGRSLAHAMLRAKGLTRHQTVPISAGLLVDTESYFDALSAYRDGDAAPIVHRFADATRFAAVTGRGLVDGLAEQLELSRTQLAGVRPQAAAWKVLPKLIAQPVVSSRYLTGTLDMNEATVKRTLDTLVERGVLVERTGFRRNRVWQHPGILDVLDRYAETIRRGST